MMVSLFKVTLHFIRGMLQDIASIIIMLQEQALLVFAFHQVCIAVF